jgi:DNA-binding GntR family transcriptional regulator
MATSSELAYDKLRRLILQGEFEMGARLGEVELAARLELSRTPIREALRRLAADGLVEMASNRGARVASWSDADIDETFVLRSILEGHGAALAAANLDVQAIEGLEKLCDRMEALGSRRLGAEVDDLNALNREFHERVLHGAGSPRLPALVSSLTQMPLAKRTFSRYSDEAMARSSAHHRELVAAFRARNAEWARAVMVAHVQAARFEVSLWDGVEDEAENPAS